MLYSSMTPASSQVLRVASSHRETCTSPMCAVPMSSIHRRLWPMPLTMGGGIGQSRLCMLLLGSAHIGEVQASVWDNATREACEKAGIPLL